jgi:antitoxin component of RelBE/YafQ-DinJ toxin-antitoxin module
MEYTDLQFRLHRDVADKANAICARHGVQLADVLRGVVTRIATEGSLPSQAVTHHAAGQTPLPFDRYDARLWDALQLSINAELAVELLAACIADCSAQLAEIDPARKPHRELADRLERKRREALQLRQTLDVNDADAVAAVLRAYGRSTRPEAE